MLLFIEMKHVGYLLGAIAAITYGMNPLFALPLYEDGMDAYSVLLFRYLFGAIMIGIMLYIRQPQNLQEQQQQNKIEITQAHPHPIHIFRMERKYLLPLSLLGISMGISSLTLFVSYNYMDAGIASTLLFVYPIMVAVGMSLFFKEKIKLQTIFCILIALCGIFLLYKKKDGSTLSLIDTILVFVSALTYAIYLIGINRHGLSRLPTLKVTFYVLIFALLVYVVSVIINDKITLPSRWYLWFNLLALGILPTVVSFVCTTAAIQRIGSTPVAILGALEPATAVFFGITVFGEQMTMREAIGLTLIVLAVTVVVAGGNITQPLTRFRKLFPRKS